MTIEIHEQATIHRPAWEVREQFRDITYHSGHRVHSALRMKVVERRGGRCRYLLTSSIGPLALEHLVVLDVADDGVLVNAFVAGALRGAFLDLRFDWTGPDETVVSAALTVPERGPVRWFGPLARRHLTRQLRRMLDEERADLEAAPGVRAPGRLLHPSLG